MKCLKHFISFQQLELHVYEARALAYHSAARALGITGYIFMAATFCKQWHLDVAESSTKSVISLLVGVPNNYRIGAAIL